MIKFFQPYHLVSESPWPLNMSFCLILLMLSVIEWFKYFLFDFVLISLFLVILNVYQWWRDVIREGTFQGNHLLEVSEGLRLGMILFILSEIMFFVSFFWTYFHMFLSPGLELGSFWPPYDILLLNPYNIPLLNTLLLLSSGFSITWCHYMILNSDYEESLHSFVITLVLGVLFVYFQYLEYNELFYSISDSSFGSIFYMATGFHGLHVIIGILFIYVSFNRVINNHFSMFHHFGFEAASWYWHFVDVVWLFLYLNIYWLSY